MVTCDLTYIIPAPNFIININTWQTWHLLKISVTVRTRNAKQRNHHQYGITYSITLIHTSSHSTIKNVLLFAIHTHMRYSSSEEVLQERFSLDKPGILYVTRFCVSHEILLMEMENNHIVHFWKLKMAKLRLSVNVTAKKYFPLRVGIPSRSSAKFLISSWYTIVC